MREFKDKDLSTSLYIFDLLTALQPQSVNMTLVTAGDSEENKKKNAQYAISCARKMGCTVFLLPEDIVEVNPKMMMTYFGAIMSIYGN
jgi:plastin-1